MNELFLIATVLGITGVTSSFLLFFYLREHGYDEGTIQSLLFLKLLIAGHSTIFVTRTKKAFWRKPWPSPMLLSTIFGTELIGTLIVVNGLFITSISWMDVFYIWLYALGWFMFNDVIKLVTYRLFDNTQTNG
jgi:H+-transporting ATPase